MLPLEAPSLATIRLARERIAGSVVRTPLVRLETDAPGQGPWLKLECLQPTGSFKLRGAVNALAQVPRAELAQGVWTASAGNMAQGVAWEARRLGVPCTVVMPDRAPEIKRAAVRRLGANVVAVPHADWWQALQAHAHPGMQGRFVHPVSDPAVIAGNATIGLELLEELPDVDTVLVPYGGGGLSCGIAAAVRAVRPQARVYACEVETAAPLAAALAAGGPQTIVHVPSFVDGIGGRGVLAEMWPLAHALLAGSRVVSLAAIAAAIRLLAERVHVIAEGAGAAPVAAALDGAGEGRVACVVSGGNLDATALATILGGGVP
ncbi:MAG TPA: pyridoxal-phosphate dependent enzyme [Candidatus Eisenbacteria bacterium]|nr:pyridoxal-phosphate dependent enzyme [Candidatus Eisenbacteria bacterium]